MTLIAYAGYDPTETPYSRPVVGLAAAFIEQAKQARRQELNRQGLVKFRGWGMPEWARRIIIEACDKHDVFAIDLASHSRRHRVVRARNEAIYLMKSGRKWLSCLQIANWFDRNHVAILYAISTHSRENGLPTFTEFDAMERVKRQRRQRAGE